MPDLTGVAAAGPMPKGKQWLRLDNRFLPPLLITSILVAAHWSFGVLEGYERTGLAIATALATEAVLGRITYGKWPYAASAYITGISVGILLRSQYFWPYALCAFISIVSKYVLRFRGRHLWNPSNLGVSLVLLLAPDTVSLLSVQWGNAIAPMVVIWVLGSVIVWRVGRFYLSATYVASFVLFSFVRAAVSGTPWVAAVAPITGPMYQLFIFFMVTDPKVTVRPMWAQCLVVFLVAVVELIFRLNEVVDAPFYALALVGPSALLAEMWLDARVEDAAGGGMKAVEEYAGEGQLTWPGETGRAVGYKLTRLQGMARNGLPVPGLFRIEGDLELRGGSVPASVVGSTVTLRLSDGRSLNITLTTRDGRVLSEGHGPSRCLCC